MKQGDVIQLRAYGGKKISRRVVATEEMMVYVTKEEEYQKAKEEGREPVSVGFPLEAVIEEAIS